MTSREKQIKEMADSFKKHYDVSDMDRNEVFEELTSGLDVWNMNLETYNFYKGLAREICR